MKKLMGLFGITTALVLVALVKASPAEADSVYLDLYDVSCNADNDSVYFSVIADGGSYDLPVLMLNIENLDGTTDETYATGLFTGHFEDVQQFPYVEDFQVGDHIVVSTWIDSNDEADEVLATDIIQVECTGIQASGGGFKVPTDDDREIGDLKAPEQDANGSTVGGYRPQFYFPMN